VVAVGAAGRPGMLRRRLAARRPGAVPMGARLAGAAGTGLRAVLAGVLAVRALAGVVLVAYGAWLAWPPGGFMVAGLVLLADRLGEERKERPAHE